MQRSMRAMVLDTPGTPLQLREVPTPSPGPGQLLLRVHACGVCRTDLHIVDGELAHPRLPLILGHQIVGTAVQLGPAAAAPTAAAEGADVQAGTGPPAAGDRVGAVPAEGDRVGAAPVAIGDTVGVSWLGWTDGTCAYCRSGRENLCDDPRFTGYDIDGGFAEFAVADMRYCFPIPLGYPALQAAPLLCAGLIGYRSLRLAGDARRIGLYGFGAASHILVQVARHQGRTVFAFTRPGDEEAMRFAREMGAEWVGDSLAQPPEQLDAAIIMAPVGNLVPLALRALAKGGVVVCGGIHMSDIPSFPYEILWQERSIRSVANLTRADGVEFLALAPRIPVHTRVTAYPLESAQQALDDLRAGRLNGAAVVEIG